METESSTTVCSALVKQYGVQTQENNTEKLPKVAGLIEDPLLVFLKSNPIIHATAMIRKSFLNEHQLKYDDCLGSEDFKLWIEIAKHGGHFYIDTQQLAYCRAKIKKENEPKHSDEIVCEVLEFLTNVNNENCPELQQVFNSFKSMRDKQMMSPEEVVGFFIQFFTKNRNNLKRYYANR
jgi:hypothetical protein